MVHILGVQLRDHCLARVALIRFYGVGLKTAHRLCARLQIHDRAKIKDLTPLQVTALTSFLSSPATAPPLPKYPLASPNYVAPPPSTPIQDIQAKITAQWEEMAKQRKAAPLPQRNPQKKPYVEPLKNLKIESELRREIRENIAHQRMIGSYVGKRHAMHLPVRGQNTQSNAKTARKLNQLDRF
ncbi:S13-like H2TH domain-containing protein [Macrolepiota fuliginosa MF-IS2]|uniref:Small ribosomal subunit protein uS13m n=1 Tax=Macrolepiota fuliginosa MF-IS2 TaxID=1400762 RepID=A0A9P5XNI6_9AGAR|nr:S13-like H2TH domain-containing protein [Macrolepiota fuliginosa MF-IS2]